MSRNFLCVPTTRDGDGTGHLLRSLRLAEELRKNGQLAEVYSDPPASVELLSRLKGMGGTLLPSLPEGKTWDFVILDRRETTPAEFREYQKLGVPVGLDEGGVLREEFPFLIDTLPRPESSRRGSAAGRGNIQSEAFIQVPRRVRTEPVTSIRRILVSFGGEDAAGLTERMIELLEETKIGGGDGDHGLPAPEVTVVKGMRFGRPLNLPEGMKLLDAPEDLRELLYRYDLVITSFGFTAYEANAAGCRVLLWNPTAYHERLSRTAGFSSLGIGRGYSPKKSAMEKRRLKRGFASFIDAPGLRREAVSVDRTREAGGLQAETTLGTSALAQTLARLTPCRSPGCPVCGSLKIRKSYRFQNRSFFRCGGCGAIRQLDFSGSASAYGESYFFEEYKNQYGKTYLEDYRHIRSLGGDRLRRIEKVRTRNRNRNRAEYPGTSPSPGRPVLLDVGCAYGPFLAEAEKEGYAPFGIDICPEAVEYVRSRLKIPAEAVSFEEAEIVRGAGQLCLPEPETADVVTMWYVIEHFTSPARVMSHVRYFLKPGGVFAFSTPTFSGISGRSNLLRYLADSPRDHRVILDRRSASVMAEKKGFKVLRYRSTGHHPERFPGLSGPPSGITAALFSFCSRLFGLGDTCELYCVKR